MKIISKSVTETAAFAKQTLNSLSLGSGATVLALYGDLGSGKTTFVQEFGKLLGVRSSMQSPTFVIMKSYEISYGGYKKFVHLDVYRLEEPDELARLGFKELVKDFENLIVVEWADRVEALLPQEVTRVRFKFIDETTREIGVLE